jgi:hypothetical protein
LRGAWNTNPSPYINRFAISQSSLPGCSGFYSWLEMDSLQDFMDYAPFGPHASTHGAIGGVYGCDVFDPLVEQGLLKDETSAQHICKKWSILLKELYRADFISPVTGCEMAGYGVDDNDCGFICDDDDADSMESSLKGLITTEYVPSDYSDDIWEQWRDFVCSGDGSKVFSGDHLEAASPSDPSFWPIHPNLERLYHAKMLSGGFDDSEWPTDASDVCDKSSCYEEKYDDKDNFVECCYGHYIGDQLMDFVNGNASAGFGPTNAEMLSSNPATSSYEMTYIYDDFSWSHCSDSFEDYMLGLSERRRNR